jgi:uncharacterized protein (TIGR02145 family)
MRKKSNIRNYIFAIIGVILIFTCSCKKDNDENIKPIETDSVTDVEGNVYKTVKIGNQWWMAENLKTTRYNDSTHIPLVMDSTTWFNLHTPGYCWYNNNETAYKDTYGALYNWFTVNTGKLAPIGWHIPTDDEWTILINYLGGKDVAGGKMKETGTVHWESPNKDATNESGFTALPGGERGNISWPDSRFEFAGIRYGGNWWTATEKATAGGICLLSYYTPYAGTSDYFKVDGLSVRCVRDSIP